MDFHVSKNHSISVISSSNDPPPKSILKRSFVDGEENAGTSETSSKHVTFQDEPVTIHRSCSADTVIDERDPADRTPPGPFPDDSFEIFDNTENITPAFPYYPPRVTPSTNSADFVDELYSTTTRVVSTRIDFLDGSREGIDIFSFHNSSLDDADFIRRGFI